MYLARWIVRITGVPDEVFNQVKDSLQEGLDGGETIRELSGRVKAEFNNMSDTRARRIAMTETAAAYGTGRQAAMQQAGTRLCRLVMNLGRVSTRWS